MFLEHTYRKTLKKTVEFKGIGVHSGKTVTMTLHPADCNTGIKFLHVNHKEAITGDIRSVVDTSMAVSLGNQDWKIQTVEHLMAALSATGVRDVIIELDGYEIPILDGSSAPFIEGILSVGTETYNVPVEVIEIQNPIWVMDGDKYIIVLPSDELKISYTIDFKHPKIRSQTLTVPIEEQYFYDNVLSARTFGFLEQVESLQSQGLALGGGEQNAIIFTEDGILNPDLRFDDECIRHKILDFVGDLSLLGRPIKGHFIASKAGHALDVAFGSKLLQIVENNEIKNPAPGVAGGSWNTVTSLVG